MGDSVRKWGGRVILADREIAEGVVITRGDTIEWVGDLKDEPATYQSVVAEALGAGSIITAGLVDVHCHGGGGASFPDALSIEDVTTAAHEHLRNGTTTLIASLVTAPVEVLEKRARLLAEAKSQGIIEGTHFEGPFLSEARCGAQDPRYLIPATADAAKKLVDASEGTAVSMTIAPECASDAEGFAALQILVDGNIIPSWGHTDCSNLIAEKAVETGKSLIAEKNTETRGGRASITHLFNGMRPLHHREPGPIPAFLAAAEKGEVVVEMINDGTHLEPNLVREIVELVGRENCVFVTDAMAAAGMPDGEYVLGPQAVRVQDGVARLAEGNAIAGGTARLLDCVRTAVTRSGLSLVDAVYLATVAGTRVLGLTDRGQIAKGLRADLLILNDKLKPSLVVRGGEVVA